MSTLDAADSFLDKLFRPVGRWIHESGEVSLTRKCVESASDFFGHGMPETYRPTAIGHDIKPLYFVMNIDHTFTVADPQPPVMVHDWSGSSPDHVSANVMVAQLRFLLSQAPMIDAPTALSQAAHAVTKFAYIHP